MAGDDATDSDILTVTERRFGVRPTETATGGRGRVFVWYTL